MAIRLSDIPEKIRLSDAPEKSGVVRLSDVPETRGGVLEFLFTPISKQVSGKSIGERTDFLNKSAQKLTDQAVGVGKTKEGTVYPKPAMGTAGFFMKQLPAATAQAGVEMADLSPFDVALMAATAGLAKTPVKGTTVGQVAKRVPVGKGFMNRVGELGRLEKTLKPFKGQIPGAVSRQSTATARAIQSATDGPNVYGRDGKIIKHAEKPEIHPSLDKILPEEVVTSIEKRATGLEAARRGYIPFKLQRKLGAEIPISQIDYDNIKPGDIVNSERLRAFRGDLIKQLGDLVNSPETKDQFMKNVQKVYGLQSEVGRTLGALSDDVVVANDEMSYLVNLLKNVDPDVKSSVEGLYKNLATPGFWDKYLEFRTAMLLTSPLTHERNIIGNLIGRIFFPAEKLTAGVINAAESTLRGMPRERYVREGIADIVGMARGLRPALRNTIKAFSDENFVSNARISEAVRFRQAIPGIAGKAVRLPFRALNAMDEFFSTLSRSASLYSQATKQAIKESSKNISSRVAELVKNPTPEMINSAETEALFATFRQPMGRAGQSAQKLINQLKINGFPFGKFILPFFKTPINLFKWSASRNPISSVPVNWKSIVGASAGQRADALARVSLGQIISAGIFYEALQGNITGRLSGDYRKREAKMRQGIQPYSIKLGNKYLSYRSLEPVASWIGMMANFAEIANEENRFDTNKTAIAIAETIKMMKDQSFLQGISVLFDALDDPENYAERFVQDSLASHIPSGVSYLARLQDPVVRDPNSIPEAIKSKLPYFSKTVEPKLDVWGRPITREGTLAERALLPGGTMTSKPDLTESELLSLDYYPRRITKSYRSIKLTTKERNLVTRAEGTIAKELLDQAVQTKEYQGMNPEEQYEYLNKIIMKVRKEVRAGIIPEVYQRKLRELKTDEEKTQLLEKITRKRLYKR